MPDPTTNSNAPRVVDLLLTENVRTADLIAQLTNDQAASRIRQCLILRQAGGKLPPMQIKLEPEMLGLPLEQSTSAKSLLKLGAAYLLPEGWRKALEVPRGRISNWISFNCLDSIFGRLVPIARWARPGYVKPESYASDAKKAGINATFRECFDQAQWELQRVVDALVDDYPAVRSLMRDQSLTLGRATYRQIQARFQKEPDAYPDFQSTVGTNGEVVPVNPQTGQPLLEQDFAETYWQVIELQMPTIEQIQQSCLYYDIQAVPTSAYEPLGIEGSETFDEDLRRAHDEKLSQFNHVLEGVMTQIWEHISSITGNLIDSLQNQESVAPKTATSIKGLMEYVRTVNINEDPLLAALGDELAEAVTTSGKLDPSGIRSLLIQARTAAKVRLDQEIDRPVRRVDTTDTPGFVVTPSDATFARRR